ncbi:MAG: deoxyhypusine synthase [Candidatus Bathyarchaeota archaeon]|nr:MAG: deoxyhypusine synthase [Candidatus Bathyarchaeota archaeon]
MSVRDLLSRMRRAGVLGAGRIGKAVEIMAEMVQDKDYVIFLAIAGPMIPAGLRNIISDLIKNGVIDVIVTSGSNIVHDLIEAIGFRHVQGSDLIDDRKLRMKGIGRIADIYIEQDAFIELEKKTFELLDGIPEEKRKKISISNLLYDFGRQLEDEDSLLFQAAKLEVPIFCPGLFDSMIGYHLWTYSQNNIIGIDGVLDLNQLSEKIFQAKKTGAIILGGGLPKHFTLGANMLREGVDAAFQITLDRPEAGSLSGAPLEEAISWRKAKQSGRFCTVIGDATICFPLIVSAAIDIIDL